MDSPACNIPQRVLADYSALEYILVGDLRDLLEEAADEQNRKWLLAVVDALLDTLPREFDLKEQGGYLTEVLEQFPNWQAHVDRLQQDHDQLCSSLKELRDRIAREVPFTDIVDELRRDLRDWMINLTAHHRHETRIVQQAVNLEIGAAD